MAQLLPFQRSTSVFVLLVPLDRPTAVHALGEVHETPASSLPLALAGGMGWILHCVPSHAAASAWAVPVLSRRYPMAVQAAAEEHDTPKSWLSL